MFYQYSYYLFQRCGYFANNSIQIAKKHQNIAKTDLTREETEDIVKDAFNSAGERDIYTGDHVQLLTISAEGITEIVFDLKYD